MAIATSTALLGAGALGLAGSLLGSQAQSDAMGDAAYLEKQSRDAAIAEQRRQFNSLVALNKPFRDAGVNSLSQLISMSKGDITKTPQYLLQRDEGEEAINRAAAARGGYGSTSTVENLGEFNRRLLSSETDKQYGRLLDLVNIGRGATTTAGVAGMQTAQSISNTLMQSGSRLSDLSLSEGQNQASLYSNLGAMPMQFMKTMNDFGVF